MVLTTPYDDIPEEFKEEHKAYIEKEKSDYLNKTGKYAPQDRPSPDLSWKKIELKTFMNNYSVPYKTSDTKQNLLDKILGHNYD